MAEKVVDSEVQVEKREGKPEHEVVQEVVVELDDKNQPVKPAEKKEEPKYINPDELRKITDEAIKKATAPLHYELRKFKERFDQPPQPQPVSKPEVQPDEWDLRVQKDWKGTVRELARIEAQELRKKEREEERIQNEQQRRNNLSQSNQQKVLEKHPELNDITSDKAKIFQGIVMKNPDYVNDPFGPVLAMRDMEDELRAQGKVVDEPTRKIVDNEINRRTRTNASVVSNGSSSSDSKKYTLTQEDKSFCDANNIKYDKYIASRQKLISSGGVEV